MACKAALVLVAVCFLLAAGRVQAAPKTVAMKTLILTTPGCCSSLLQLADTTVMSSLSAGHFRAIMSCKHRPARADTPLSITLLQTCA